MAETATAETISERLDKLYEFDREPVTADKLHDGRYFAAMFSGEHVAGTEFVIGALFVQWGATARDLILGLAIGNLLAILSWAFICAPIGVRVRLTLYWYARRIIGPGLTVVYNIVNALLYCCLAAAMIGVSASAVGLAVQKLGLPFEHPSLDDLLPNSITWVVIVLAVGAGTIALAIMGFKKLSQFSAVCSPWMFPIFVAGALATLPRLGNVRHASDVWEIARTQIWNGEPLKAAVPAFSAAAEKLEHIRTALDAGRVPEEISSSITDSRYPLTMSEDSKVTVDRPGQRWHIRGGDQSFVVDIADGSQVRISFVQKEHLGFWHILFFAWFCNLAMHIGLSDLAVFRFARHWSYGFYSAFGMYLGHYLAWMCAGVMGAVVWGVMNPGLMAWEAAGLAGLLCVLLAGWTTANPTIYRAGLALQIITPNWPRWMVTLAAGGVTTAVAIFPAIFMRLLDFVAIYGLMLMPIGAIIVTEFWFFGRLGLARYWTATRGRFVNGPALVAWAVTMAVCFPIEIFTGGRIASPMSGLGVHLFFRWLPGWFMAAGLYTILCYIWPGTARGLPIIPQEDLRYLNAPAAHTAGGATQPARAKNPSLMWVAGAVSLLSLLWCLYSPVRVLIGGSDPLTYAANMDSYKRGLLIATITYFVGAIYWEAKREEQREGT